MSNKKVLELQFSSHYGYFGSKEHFFHFYWGYVLPGLHVAITQTKREPGDYSLVLEDCGPVMNKVSGDLFGLLSDDIKFVKHEEFSNQCAQVPRWDIMINFDSVLFEDEYSFRGSTKEYRDNELLKSVLNQPGFLQNFQNEMREVRGWVLGKVIGPEAAKSGTIRPRERKVELTGPPPVKALKRSIIDFLQRQGPQHVQVRQKMLRNSLNVYRGISGKMPVAVSPKKRKAKRARKPKILLLCRSPEPEYYSEKGQAQAKKYGASRRTLIDIKEGFEFFKSKGHNIQMYEPGSDDIFAQIKKFYGAKIVIGVKGAELANTFWMRPGSKMLIITPSVMRSTPVYQRFGRFLGISSTSIYAADGQNPSLYRLRREINDQL